MRNCLKVVALSCTLLAGSAMYTGAVAAEAKGPTVSKHAAKPLKEAQEAMAAQNWDKALAALKTAQGVSDRNAYDNFVIDAWLGTVYVREKNYDGAASALYEAAHSQYASADQARQWLKAVFSVYYQEKNYAKAVQVGDEAIQRGNNGADMVLLVAQAEYLEKNYKAAATRMQALVDKQSKPEEKSLEFLWDCYVKSNDDTNAYKTVEKLVAYYPKPDYWLNALAPLLKLQGGDQRVQMEIYRLMDEVGVLKEPSSYTDLARYASSLGYPGLAVKTLNEAFARNLFTSQVDKNRAKAQLTDYEKRAATDKAQLDQSAKDAAAAATGDAYMGVGGGYLSYGMYPQAVSALQKAVAKGGLKFPDEANLLLGIAQYRARNLAAAREAFDKVAQSRSPAYSRLGRLWSLHARG